MKKQVSFLLAKKKQEASLINQINEVKSAIQKADLMDPKTKMSDEETTNQDYKSSFSFISNEDQLSEWLVEMDQITLTDIHQLEVVISSKNYTNRVEDNFLENLKLTIKESLKDYWKNIFWLYDLDSELLATTLYPELYGAENLSRQFINTLMVQNYGPNWWDTYAPEKLKNSHKNRVGDYKALVVNFNDVDDKLMSIDTGDLIELMKVKTLRFEVDSLDELNSVINNNKRDKVIELQKFIRENSVEDVNMWDDLFSEYLSPDFLTLFKKFENQRNHIMHNKLIDRSAYNEILQTAKYVKEAISKAIKEGVLIRNIRGESTSWKPYEDLDLELENTEPDLKSPANIMVSEFFAWLDEFEKVLANSVDLRGYLHYERAKPEVDQEGYTAWFQVVRNIDSKTLLYSYKIPQFIDMNDGAKSALQLKVTLNDDIVDQILVDYVTMIYYDYNELGNEHEPKFEGRIEHELRNTIAKTLDKLDLILTSPIEEAEQESHYSIIDGGTPAVLENVSCVGCGLESIYGGEEIAEYGQCLECGYKNKITECTRCGTSFVGPHPTEEIPSPLCSNCLKMLHDE